MPNRILSYLLEFRWGGYSLAALYVSVLSGLVVAWQYDPAEPYYSSGTLELIAPFGSFWRSCHFYSSQVFFLLLLLHFLVVLINRRLLLAGAGKGRKADLEARPGEAWGRLYLTLPVSLLLLFTGYVLRGDSTGESAGLIGENIIRSLPFLAKWLNPLLFNITEVGMRVVYVNHLVGLGLVLGMLAWNHLRRYRIRISEYGPLLAAMLVFSIFQPAPFEPFQVGTFHITGPWFFVGIQELLLFLQPLWGGITFPLLGLAWGYLILKRPGELRHPVFLTVWALVYLALTISGWR